MSIKGWKAGSLAVISVALGTLITVSEAPRPQGLVPAGARNATTRKVYPYSVISGGVGSAGELRNALLHDRAAALHYADFRLDRTRVLTLPEPRQVFVSYRIADRIYWTRKRLLLPKGETILTDGISAARTRCGNRLSETPHFPVSAELEPPAEVLDSETVDTMQAASNLQANEEGDDSWTEKLVSTSPPSGDLLTKFGPESMGVMSGLGFRTDATNGGGGYGGGMGASSGGVPSGGSGGGSGTNSGGLKSNPGSGSGVGGSGVSGGVVGGTLSGSPIAPSGTTSAAAGPALSNGTQSSFPYPVGNSVPPAFVNAVPIGLTPRLPSSTGVFFAVLPIESYLPQKIAEQFGNPYSPASSTSVVPSASVLSLSHPVSAVPDLSPVPAVQNPAVLNPILIHDVNVPEPRTLALAAAGMALFLFRLIRSRSLKRRALR